MVFVNRLTADGKYHVEGFEDLQLPIEMELSEKPKLYLNFLFHFSNVHQMFNILKKRMIVIANVFPKLETVKIFVTPLSKKCC